MPSKAQVVHLPTPSEDYDIEFMSLLIQELENALEQLIQNDGATGSFTSADGKTVQVINGIVTSIE